MFYQIPLGPLQTNCYILKNNENACLIFDPGEEGGKLINFIQENGWQPKAILLTHAHFDHIGAVDEVREFFKIPVYIHEKEANWLSDPMLNGSQLFMGVKRVEAKEADYLIKGEQLLKVDNFSFQVFETPGHSPGSVSYYFSEHATVVSGDALFQYSIGRTDLPGGDQQQLLKSIHEKLLTLPEETTVLSGHGPKTTIGAEMDSNPFLNGF